MFRETEGGNQSEAGECCVRVHACCARAVVRGPDVLKRLVESVPTITPRQPLVPNADYSRVHCE